MLVTLATLAILAYAGLISATDVCAQQAKSDPTANCNAIHLPGLHDIVQGGTPYTIRWNVSNFVLPASLVRDADPPSLEQYRDLSLHRPLPGALYRYPGNRLHRRPRPKHWLIFLDPGKGSCARRKPQLRPQDHCRYGRLPMVGPIRHLELHKHLLINTGKVAYLVNESRERFSEILEASL